MKLAYPVLCVALHTLVEHTELPLYTHSVHRISEQDIISDVRKLLSIKTRPTQTAKGVFLRLEGHHRRTVLKSSSSAQTAEGGRKIRSGEIP